MTFSPDVREAIFIAQNGRCMECAGPIQDFHHKAPNTKLNRKLYPAVINSVFNCVGLCRACHDSSAIHKYKIPEGVLKVWEEALQQQGG